MEIILQPSLPHQQKGVDSVAGVFADTHIKSAYNYYSNPEITILKDGVGNAIQYIQSINKIPAEYSGYTHDPKCLHLDIKMETGTGKTYVYTKTIFELNKLYGINKFVIAVPSLAIKEGTRQFIDDGYVKRHFRDLCGYEAEIELLTIETSKKKGRLKFPVAVTDFFKGSNRNTKKIYVLLVNMQLLKIAKNYILSRDDYDNGIENYKRPYDAICATKPFVIIDEPHRFSKDQKAFGVIKNEIKPQCIIRFGATFPEKSIGKGKNKKKVKEYSNLIYDLNACTAFNSGLIKGVTKEHLEPISEQKGKIKLISVKKNESAVFQYDSIDSSSKKYTLQVNESLSRITDAFNGIILLKIDKHSVELSNGQIKTVGEEMNADIFMNSYQEQLIRLAIERHFEIERQNFSGRKFKIKTLALFFIDDISSYGRNTDTNKEKTPYILNAFESLLKQKLIDLISKLPEEESEYREYLKASLNNIKACHAGYFSQDNNSSDEEIDKQVKLILKGKKELLSFTNPDGSPMLCRFLFSKWTLKEGWDNPNVFTIAKLRSSGSEISKLQEVGRGLRLPVDECGNRISNQEFTLNYIVDFTDRKFAEQLVDQINKEVPETIHLSETIIKDIARKMGKTDSSLVSELLNDNFIDISYNVIQQNRTIFFEKYPLFNIGIKSNKIKDRNKQPSTKSIGIRKAKFNELAELWKILNQRYTIWYEININTEIEKALLDIFRQQNVFSQQIITSYKETIGSNDTNMHLTKSIGVQYSINQNLSYGLFLKRISTNTGIPVNIIHKAICKYTKIYGLIKDNHFNINSVIAITNAFTDWKIRNMQGRFNYKRTNDRVNSTALTHADGSVRKYISQGRIGSKIKEGEATQKYLYDMIAYDSPLELENIETDITTELADVAEIIVYGKIPKNSIAIPTIGGTYSPDFMYVVKKTNGEKELNIIVETKDVKNLSDLRGTERSKIECAKIFFKNLANEGYNVQFRTQINNEKIVKIVKEVISDN